MLIAVVGAGTVGLLVVCSGFNTDESVGGYVNVSLEAVIAIGVVVGLVGFGVGVAVEVVVVATVVVGAAVEVTVVFSNVVGALVESVVGIEGEPHLYIVMFLHCEKATSQNLSKSWRKMSRTFLQSDEQVIGT